MSHSDAHNLLLSASATIGEGVRFGANVVVHDGVVIGDGVTIGDGAILGKRPALAPGSAATGAVDEPLVIGAGSVVSTQAIVFTASEIGERTIIGDQAYVRERCRIGNRTVVGRGACVDNDVRIGDRVSIQSGVYLTAFSRVADDAFIGPAAMMTNDDTMNRHARDYELRGASIGRAARIGGGSVLRPGVEVGEEAFVAAGAVVTANVAPRSVVMGVPGRVVRQVSDEDLLERWR